LAALKPKKQPKIERAISSTMLLISERQHGKASDKYLANYLYTTIILFHNRFLVNRGTMGALDSSGPAKFFVSFCLGLVPGFPGDFPGEPLLRMPIKMSALLYRQITS
jgi:hypothetical protein